MFAIKPMQTFLQRLNERLDTHDKSEEVRVAIVGGGIGSIEIAFCLKKKMIDEGRAHSISLITRASQIGRGLSSSTQKLIQSQLEAKEIELITGRSVEAILTDAVRLDTQKIQEADLIIWGTCLLYTSPSPRDATLSRMPSSA